LGKRKSSIAWQNIVQASVRLCHTEKTQSACQTAYSMPKSGD